MNGLVLTQPVNAVLCLLLNSWVPPVAPACNSSDQLDLLQLDSSKASTEIYPRFHTDDIMLWPLKHKTILIYVEPEL